MKAEIVLSSVAWLGLCAAYYRNSKLSKPRETAKHLVRTQSMIDFEMPADGRERQQLEKLFNRPLGGPLKTAYGTTLDEDPH